MFKGPVEPGGVTDWIELQPGAVVTGVDLIEENKLETVYHAYSIEKGGGPVVFKVQVDRDNPVSPSLTSVWPGADFQERESFDMVGIQYEGHPDLRRILTR